MGSTLGVLRVRAKGYLKNRSDLDTQIEQALNDQLKELCSNIRPPETDGTSISTNVASGNSSVPISTFVLSGTEVAAIINVKDVTDLTNTFPLDQDDVREMDRITLMTAVPKRYCRFGTDILFDAKIPAGGRNYIIRYRREHPTLTAIDASLLPSIWDEVVALGAALRVARDVISDYDLADEIEKQFTRAMRARGLTKEEETRDAEFGLQVIY